MESAGTVKDKIAVSVRPKLHGDFPDVVALELLDLDAGSDGIGDDVEGWREPGAEVSGKLASAWAGAGEDVIEDAGMGEGVVHVAVHAMDHSALKGAAAKGLVEETGELLEFGVHDLVEESFPVREVVIDGHGSDADFAGDAPHADGLRAFGLENAKR